MIREGATEPNYLQNSICTAGYRGVSPSYKNKEQDQIMQTTRLGYVRTLLSDVSYKQWDFVIGNMGDGTFLQPQLSEVDQIGNRWKGRKWYISNHATDSEIIATAFKAVLTAEEHETREQFLFQGYAIFGPHLSLDALKRNAEETDHRPDVRGLGASDLRRPGSSIDITLFPAAGTEYRS